MITCQTYFCFLLWLNSNISLSKHVWILPPCGVCFVHYKNHRLCIHCSYNIYPLILQSIHLDFRRRWDMAGCENFLNSYLEYLKTLNFHLINERPPTRQGRHSLSPSHTPLTHPLYLYKCLQRSWTGGIMLIDMSFISRQIVFHWMLQTK